MRTMKKSLSYWLKMISICNSSLHEAHLPALTDSESWDQRNFYRFQGKKS